MLCTVLTVGRTNGLIVIYTLEQPLEYTELRNNQLKRFAFIVDDSFGHPTAVHVSNLSRELANVTLKQN